MYVRTGEGTGQVTALPQKVVAEVLMIGQVLAQGVRDENQLANLVFFAQHPERRDSPIQPHERARAQQWLYIKACRV